MLSIQELLDAVKAERAVNIRSDDIEKLVRAHFDEFGAAESGLTTVEVKPVYDHFFKGFTVNLLPRIGGVGTHPFPKQVQISERPAPHDGGYCLLDEDDEAWVRFFEQFQWQRLGFLNKLEGGRAKRIYEIGRKFDYGFWAIISV